MVVRPNLFRKFQNVKALVKPLTKKCCFRRSFDSQHVQWSQTPVKSSWEHFYHIFPSLWGQIIWKMLLLLKFEMIGVFVNTWAADFKYPVPDCENLQFSFKCNYLKNKKLFMSILCHLWNLDQIWNIFKKMKIVIAQVFLKLKTVKDFVRSLTKKCRLITSLNSQHVEVSQILVRALLSYFSINLRRNDLGNIPSIWSLKS